MSRLFRRSSLTFLLAGWLASSPTTHAQPIPLGGEFQVNSYTFGTQFLAGVAADTSGNFVIVWQSDYGAGTDTSNFSIQAQRYDGTGAAQGSQFQVNTHTTAAQIFPAVARDAAGNFVVVWASVGSVGSDNDALSIQGQRYDAAGATLGTQFQVNTYSTGNQSVPAVAADASGNFLVVWQSNGSAGTDSDQSIQGQRYNSAGVPVGGQFQVNDYVTGNQGESAVAADGAGNFVVSWQSAGSSGSDVSGVSIQCKRYDGSGAMLTPEQQVNTYTTGTQFSPAVSADAIGNFVVAWQSYGSVGSDAFGRSIQAQRYDASGTPQAGQFQVNTYTTGDQSYVSVTSDVSGDFVVIWTSIGGVGPDLNAESIQGQHYYASGIPASAQFQVNTYGTSSQVRPVVAAGASGTFVVAWDSVGSVGPDDISFAVEARRFALPTTTSTSTTSSTSTSTSLPPTDLLPGRISIIKPGALAKFVAKPVTGDTFALPTADPTAVGGTLRIFDVGATAGDDTYNLPAGSWKGLGNPAGAAGYKYRGTGTAGDPCKVVLVKPKVIKGVCVGAGVTLTTAFAGDIGIVLSLGATDRFCAQLGGDTVRNDETLTKRKNAPAPSACP